MLLSRESTPHVAAVIFSTEQFGSIRIAALTVLDRLVVTLHRAGCASITIVSHDPLPDLRRSRALGIQVNVVPEPPAIHVPTLVATANLLVQPSDVRELIQRGGRLATADGAPLSIGIVTGNSSELLSELSELPIIRAQAFAAVVTREQSAQAVERAFWSSLTSSSDGFVDRHFNRPVGRPISKLLIHTPVSPNAVSLASILIGLAAAACFAVGEYAAGLIGAVLFQLSAVIDCMDGDVARALFKESALGKWLDLAGDQVVHVAVFAAMAAGLFRQGSDKPVLWLGLSAVTGAILSFTVVVRGVKRSSLKGSTLQRLIDSATNRDFSVLVLALAIANQLDLFLWMVAIGSHAFWIALLCLQRLGTRSLRADAPTTA